MARAVTMIPPTISTRFSSLAPTVPAQRKVAAYARVSTDSDEQLTSYEAQVDYYTKYIKERADWDFVSVYTDEGISATQTKHRTGFNEMIADALTGKIDLIVTKSVSRFARNTVDSLTAVRQLKEKGVEVYFEKENIFTFDGKGELLITIMSSLAQEESRSISENVTWGKRKRIADGKIDLPYSHFLGYKKGEDGFPQIVPEEAETVRLIYRLFVQGKTTTAIAKHLTEQSVPTPGGKSKWRCTTVESILTNEKYKGSALLQKKFTVDFLTKKRKLNEGELPQYYIENSHDAIIDPTEFDMVQIEMERRKTIGRQYSCGSPFSAKIICGECGAYFGPKVWNSTTKYRRTVWQCNDKFKGEKKCETPHLTEDNIKGRFLVAFNQLMKNRDEIVENCRLVQAVVGDFAGIDSELMETQRELEIVTELTRKCIEENAHTVIKPEAWGERYGGYLERYNKANDRIKELESLLHEQRLKFDALENFIADIEHRELVLTEFDDGLWAATADRVTVFSETKSVFKFKDGTELEV